MSLNSEQQLALVDRYSARNYLPLPVILARGEGVWVWDNEDKKYLDMLSSYSALNQGHRHPRIVKVMKDQLDRLALTSRAFHHDQFGPFCEYICNLAGQDQILMMNTGAEGVETAIKCSRKWGYDIKGVPADKAEIIVCENNFHGRTTTIVGFSSEPAYRNGFGPFPPGFKIIPFNDLAALEQAITPNTVGFLVEPIQGEAGIIVPGRRIPAQSKGVVPQAQCPADCRRNPDRAGPHRQAVLLRVRRHQARHPGCGQGAGRRLFPGFRDIGV